MIKLFADPMKAYIFKAQMESEGKNAYVLDENVSLLYGPIATSHIRVLVSENEEVEYEKHEFKLLRLIYSTLWNILMISVGLIILLELLTKPGDYLVLAVILAMRVCVFLSLAISVGILSNKIIKQIKGTWIFTVLAVVLAAFEFMLAGVR